MTSARAEARPRAGGGGAWWPPLGIAAIGISGGVFLVPPLARIFYAAFSDDAGRLTVRHFVDFATDGFYRRSLWNSLVLGLGTVAATSVLGFAIAMLLVRYDFVGRSLFSNLTLIPIVAPPDRKSTRLNSSHLVISYAVFCLKKKNKNTVGSLHSVDLHGSACRLVEWHCPPATSNRQHRRDRNGVVRHAVVRRSHCYVRHADP